LSILKSRIITDFTKDFVKVGFNDVSSKFMTRWKLGENLYMRFVYWTSIIDDDARIRLGLYLNL
jgi:hypothetical protein